MVRKKEFVKALNKFDNFRLKGREHGERRKGWKIFVFKGKREWSKVGFEKEKKSLYCVRENRRET